MDVTTSAIATALTVTVGRWSQGKQLTMQMIFGFVILTIFLAVMQDANSKLAQQFALLILITAVLIYGVDIGKKVGALNKS